MTALIGPNGIDEPPEGVIEQVRVLDDACTCGWSKMACDANLHTWGTLCCEWCTGHEPDAIELAEARIRIMRVNR